MKNNKEVQAKRNQKIILLIIPVLLLLLLVIICNVIKKEDEAPKETIILNEAFTEIGVYGFQEGKYTEKDHPVFTSYETFKKEFPTVNALKETDFQNHNYVLVPISFNSCSQSQVTPTDYTIDGENIHVLIKYNERCGLCAQEYVYYLLEVEKSMTVATVTTEKQVISKKKCDNDLLYTIQKPSILGSFPLE